MFNINKFIHDLDELKSNLDRHLPETLQFWSDGARFTPMIWAENATEARRLGLSAMSFEMAFYLLESAVYYRCIEDMDDEEDMESNFYNPIGEHFIFNEMLSTIIDTPQVPQGGAACGGHMLPG